MPAPGRREAASLLLSLRPAPWFARHSRAVAEVASWLALAAMRRGLRVDRPAVEAAALLHDADKALPREDPVRRLRHGEASAAWLAGHGLAELGPLVAWHPVTRLSDADAAEAWLATGSLESLLVAYADKRAGQHLERMDERFASWTRRYPLGTKHGWDEGTAQAVLERARRLEGDVCERLGIRPEQVRRVAWTGRAFREAQAADPGLRASAAAAGIGRSAGAAESEPPDTADAAESEPSDTAHAAESGPPGTAGPQGVPSDTASAHGSGGGR